MGKIFQRTRTRSDGTVYQEPLYSLQYYNPTRKRTVVEPTGLPATPAGHKEAEKLLRDREGKNDKGESLPTSANKKTLMSKLFELLREDYKRNNRKDIYTMQGRLKNHLIPFFGNYRAMAVNYVLISKYIDSRMSGKKPAKPATVNHELSHLSASFTLGIKAGLVASKPLIELLEEKNRRKGFFERKDFLKVHAQLPAPIKPIAELAYFTGMREGELLGLLWDQVDLIECCIRLEETKNGDVREIHYSEMPELKALVDSQFEHKLETERRTGKKIDHLFFRYSTGKRVIDFRVAWKNACEEAGIKKEKGLKDKTLFHNLRRTAVRNLVQRAGVPESVAQLISGHETRSTFNRYNIRNPQDTRAALGKVSHTFSASSNTPVDTQIDSQINESQPEVKETKDLVSSSSRRLQ